jgi:hypothetical protein
MGLKNAQKGSSSIDGRGMETALGSQGLPIQPCFTSFSEGWNK